MLRDSVPVVVGTHVMVRVVKFTFKLQYSTIIIGYFKVGERVPFLHE